MVVNPLSEVTANFQTSASLTRCALTYDTIIFMINFTNQPTLSRHEVDAQSNERKIGLLPHIETFLNQHPLFKDKDVQVSFPTVGAASLVCIVQTSDVRQVLKIPLSTKSFYKSEGDFLMAWEKVGVKVPHVIEEGTIDSSSYLLMEYIDAKPLNDVYRKGAMIKEEIFVKMGSTLRMMHQAKSEVFGVVKDGKGGYSKFSEWLDYEINQKRPEGAAFLDKDKHGDFQNAVKIINEFVGTSTESCYCHNDFAYQNIFATDPLTVFDPIPIFGHPYLDLARAIVIALGRGISDEASEQLMRGYAGTDLVLDRQALQAAILIQSQIKFGYWSKVGKEEGIKDVQTYLEKTKGFLV